MKFSAILIEIRFSIQIMVISDPTWPSSCLFIARSLRGSPKQARDSGNDVRVQSLTNRPRVSGGSEGGSSDYLDFLHHEILKCIDN